MPESPYSPASGTRIPKHRLVLLHMVSKRLLRLAGVSFLVASATFILASFIPGDYFASHSLDPTIQPEAIESMRRYYGLDQSLWVQYLRWLKNLSRLDLGYSLFYNLNVSAVVSGAMAHTFWIGAPALILGMLAGILLGTAHAVCSDGLPGRAIDIVVLLALSLPTLVLGLTGLLLAAFTGWFPLGGMSALTAQSGVSGWLGDRAHHLLLPVFCLAVPVFAAVERVQYAAARQSINELYVRAARARGIGGWRLLTRYVIRPSLTPVLASSGPVFGGVLSGSLVLEQIFAWPGLGQVTFNALFSRDLLLLVGCVLGTSVLLICGNLIADLLLAWADPRARLHHTL